MLANTLGKLADKCIADEIQSLTHLFHNLQYGSRKGRSAMDSLMITVNKVEEALANGERATLLGKDIVSAFNQVRRTEILKSLRLNNTPSHITRYVGYFLLPRTCDIGWDAHRKGTIRLEDGSPQGSPLSPVIWLVYLATTLQRCEAKFQDISVPSRRPKKAPEVLCFSSADDTNPLIISRGTMKEHKEVVKEVINILEEEAAKSNSNSTRTRIQSSPSARKPQDSPSP